MHCVEFICEDCGAEGEGFRHADEIGNQEECWKCGGDNYVSYEPDEQEGD